MTARRIIAIATAVTCWVAAKPSEASAQRVAARTRVAARSGALAGGRLGRDAVSAEDSSQVRRGNFLEDGSSTIARRRVGAEDTSERAARTVRTVGRVRGSRAVRAPLAEVDGTQRVRLSHVGPDRWRTEGGLNLTKASIRRVLSHGHDNRRVDRPHGVFAGGRQSALAVVDSAYRRAVQGGPGVSSYTVRNGATIYEVDMGRPIGFIGGRVRGEPEARHIRLVVSGDELSTAYPFRPMNRTLPNGHTARRQQAVVEEPVRTQPVPELPEPRLSRYRDVSLGEDERNPVRERQRNWTRIQSPERQHVAEPATRETVARQLQAAYGDTRLGTATARQAGQHVELGMPTAASRTTPNDYIIARRGYVTSYNRERRVPNWVGYRVTPENVSSERFRADDFRVDPTLPRNWTVADNADYRHSGYHRGHVLSSGSRLESWRENSKTFVMTNIIPQAPGNNIGAWRHLEHHVRALARAGHEVQVFAGPGFDGPARTIGENRVAVPDFLWKVAVVTAPGQSLRDINAETRVIAIKVPNDNSVDLDASHYRTTVAEVERATGFQFFTNLPRDVAANLRTRVDHVDLGTPPDPPTY